jgi:hypothetical protein
VALGQTFALVANPDLGLTAHLSPRGSGCVPYVVSVSTRLLTVAAEDPRCADVGFDYIVYGLRLGFEDLPIVQVKQEESYLPLPETIAELESGQADAVASSARLRFEAMHERLTGGAPDLTASKDLAVQINEGRAEWMRARTEKHEQEKAARMAEHLALRERRPAPAHQGTAAASTVAAPAAARPILVEQPRPEASIETVYVNATWMEVTEQVEAGDLLALDSSQPGSLRRAVSNADPNVIGIAAGPSRLMVEGGLEAPVMTFGIAQVRADATYGAINPGDQLVSSATVGHAMRATEIVPGTILGKAIDPLEGGTGLIRVLVLAR